MKKWLYFITPVIGLGLFLVIYFSHVEEAEKLAKQKQEEIAKKDAAEAKRKAELEEIARIDAAKKAKQRADEDAKKEAEKIAAWNAQGQKIQDETNKAIQACSEYTAKIGAYEKELAGLRKAKEQANRDFLDAARDLELTKIARRNAELEVQRLTELMIRKADESSLAAVQAAAAAPAPAK